MTVNFGTIENLLSCPDDGDSLLHVPDAFVCRGCRRRFPILAGNLAEILPSRPFDLPSTANLAYRTAYLDAFQQTFNLAENSSAWGAEETVSKSWALKRHRQVAIVRPLVTEGTSVASSVLCDIAAGAGYYTFAYAQDFHVVLHCDLSVADLNYALRKARAKGIDNILFLRTDYFAPPFQHSLDRILCLDTLIRGNDHESALLKTVASSLKRSGRAVVDFHNWWHNPLRRLGVLSENFHDNCSYSRSEAERLLRCTGLTAFRFQPFRQEFSISVRPPSIFARIVPPTRLMYLFTVPNKTESPTVSECTVGIHS